jgi:hypothetical protein
VQYACEQFHAVYQTRPRPMEQAALDRIDATIPNRIQITIDGLQRLVLPLSNCSFQSKVTRHQENRFGVIGDQSVRVECHGATCLPKGINAAGKPNDVRHPVACSHQRVEPTQTEHLRPPCLRRSSAQIIEPRSHPRYQGGCRFFTPCRRTQSADVAHHLAKASRPEHDNARFASIQLQGFLEITLAHSTNRALVLGHDQIGLKSCQQLAIQLIQSDPTRRALLHAAMNLSARQVLA